MKFRATGTNPKNQHLPARAKRRRKLLLDLSHSFHHIPTSPFFSHVWVFSSWAVLQTMRPFIKRRSPNSPPDRASFSLHPSSVSLLFGTSFGTSSSLELSFSDIKVHSTAAEAVLVEGRRSAAYLPGKKQCEEVSVAVEFVKAPSLVLAGAILSKKECSILKLPGTL